MLKYVYTLLTMLVASFLICSIVTGQTDALAGALDAGNSQSSCEPGNPGSARNTLELVQTPQLTWRRSPVWTGDQTGPQDQQGRFWHDPLFDDSTWSIVTLPDTASDRQKNDRYYRAYFKWDGKFTPYLHFSADDGLTIYVNGVGLGQWGRGWRQETCVNGPSKCRIKDAVPDQPLPNSLLRVSGVGDNVIAVDLWNGACCEYYFDASLTIDSCPRLARLQKDYEQKKGTNDVAYAHYYSCLAAKGCEDRFKDNKFVSFMFKYMNTHNEGNRGSDMKCADGIPNTICLLLAGMYHFDIELTPAFYNYCTQISGEADFEQWDREHDDFLNNANSPCFEEVVASGDIIDDPTGFGSSLKDTLVIKRARNIRKGAQVVCRQLFSTPQSGSQVVLGNSKYTITYRPDMYAKLAQEATLQIQSEKGNTLSVGTQVQLRVIRAEADGRTSDITSSSEGTKYILSAEDNVATINRNGLLSIRGVTNPFKPITSSVLVFAWNGTDIGVSEFVIVDADSDGDLLVDSYEKKVGLSVSVPNDKHSDLDKDGVDDFTEILHGTNPKKIDSDEDGYADACEIKVGSDPLVRFSRPANGCDAPASGPSLCFTQTNQCISGDFRTYWEQNGGLPVFGFPITIAQNEANPAGGPAYLTQWFERNRFEWHPENTDPYKILLGRLGDDKLKLKGVDWSALPREAGPKTGCLWFQETDHNVCDQGNGVGFKTYWQAHGLKIPGLDVYAQSLQLFGLPLTEAHMEQNDNGENLLTQWFERARFEWHPDQPDQYKVLLGLLGNEIRNQE
jgi:hypothetical protein